MDSKNMVNSIVSSLEMHHVKLIIENFCRDTMETLIPLNDIPMLALRGKIDLISSYY